MTSRPSRRRCLTPAPTRSIYGLGYGYKLECCYDDKYSKPVEVFRGEGAISRFIERMLEEVEYC